jgi:hypothetical protein
VCRFGLTRYGVPWGFFENRERRGFRFVRLTFFDFGGKTELRAVRARAQFVFPERLGDVRFADSSLARAFQASLYTARVCTQPDALWDGIKRDRVGWHGDARVAKGAIDFAFFRPEPTEGLLASLPTDRWAIGVPIYSFDGAVILRDHILCYGADRPAVLEGFERVERLLDWVAATQVDDEGYIVRREGQHYFGDIGFLDWSRMPVGGRFEELAWLQARHVGGLREAACCAQLLGRHERAVQWRARADELAERVKRRFYRPGVGFLHTLNHAGDVRNPHLPGFGGHYELTYQKGIALGPSGPSRQANVLAVLAGLADAEVGRTILHHVLDNPALDGVITPYFAFFEQSARAALGDRLGAFRNMSGYITELLENEDTTTIWELYDPKVRDIRRYFSHLEVGFFGAMSLCHAWGSGLVSLTQRLVLGVEATRPGFSAVRLDPETALVHVFQAELPTPFGSITVERASSTDPIRYRIPRAIEVDAPDDVGLVVERC